ncbi:MAG TPA: hypothetical protein VGA88_08935 [Burkholderiales bacterium]
MSAKRTIPVLPADMSREAKLRLEGWVRQTTLGEPRLSEVVQTYRALGYEVEVIEHRVEGDGCNSCFEVGAKAGSVYGDVYLRKRADAPTDKDELFP